MSEDIQRCIRRSHCSAMSIGKFHLEVNTSGYALGGMLSQLRDDKWHSIAFISCTMTDAELNYDIYDKELLAIMYALKEWCPYLFDACKTFEICNTLHSPMCPCRLLVESRIPQGILVNSW